MTGLEAVLLVILGQWAVLGPLVALKYIFNHNNKNDRARRAQMGGRVDGFR